MKLRDKVRIALVSVAVAAGLALLPAARPQVAGEPSPVAVSTAERLATEDWWPTKQNVPLSSFAGSAACAGCHQQGAAGQLSAMQRASVPGEHASFFEGKPGADLHRQQWSYSVTPAQGRIQYAVAGGGQKFSHTLDWVMGAGDLGRTFLYTADGRWYQSQISFYTKPAALDVTTGLHVEPGSSLPEALGQVLSPEDARSCFGCHTVHATTTSGFNPLHAEAGLGCEACHGPALAHVNAARQSGPGAGQRIAANGVFNPAKLSPADSIDFCGSCHRTFADASLSTGPGIGTAAVRFQPYRLEESKCWRLTQDERLTCVACHDPHQPLNRESASYDRQCLSCHTAAAQHPAVTQAGAHSGAVCPKATSQCVSCHMPKVTVATMHGEFTDHFIRVVRAGEALPR